MSAPLAFEEKCDKQNRALQFEPFAAKHGGCVPINYGKSKHANPHMRGFWFATIGFMFAFIGWFALAPLTPVVRLDLGLCENDAEIQALLAAGADDSEVECECGATCKQTLYAAKISSITLDVAMRFALGGLLEQFGPVAVQSCLMAAAAVVVFATTGIQDGAGLIVMRALIGMCGSTFVIGQFWTSFLFAPSVVGAANATAGGWGNLGGGLTQVLIPAVYRLFRQALPLAAAWRATLAVPGVLFLLVAAGVRTCALDTPAGKFDVAVLGKKKPDARKAYGEALADYRVLLMVFQYSASFGTELVMNNFLATHFYDYFGVSLVLSGALALGFGGMNLFARSLGGILSDRMADRWQMRGRLWAHFLATLGSAAGLFALGCVDAEMGWLPALLVILVFSTFINMAEGTAYGIVPFMQPQNLGVVSGLVGAGGSLGGVVCTAAFYGPDVDSLAALRAHSGYILAAAATVALLSWPRHGSMLRAPAEAAPAKPAKPTGQPELDGLWQDDKENAENTWEPDAKPGAQPADHGAPLGKLAPDVADFHDVQLGKAEL